MEHWPQAPACLRYVGSLFFLCRSLANGTDISDASIETLLASDSYALREDPDSDREDDEAVRSIVTQETSKRKMATRRQLKAKRTKKLHLPDPK